MISFDDLGRLLVDTWGSLLHWLLLFNVDDVEFLHASWFFHAVVVIFSVVVACRPHAVLVNLFKVWKWWCFNGAQACLNSAARHSSGMLLGLVSPILMTRLIFWQLILIVFIYHMLQITVVIRTINILPRMQLILTSIMIQLVIIFLMAFSMGIWIVKCQVISWWFSAHKLSLGNSVRCASSLMQFCGRLIIFVTWLFFLFWQHEQTLNLIGAPFIVVEQGALSLCRWYGPPIHLAHTLDNILHRHLVSPQNYAISISGKVVEIRSLQLFFLLLRNGS